MMKPYKNLDMLLLNSDSAKNFFYSLAENRQNHVREYGHLIHNSKDLKMYGELLMKGDE